MEKKQETKKTKSLTQKAKKIRSVVMMTLLCVLLMSAATYAWFTLSNTAKATNLTMTVGDSTGLQIAVDTSTGDNESHGDFGSIIKFQDTVGKLLPATTTDGENFMKPDYNDAGEVKADLISANDSYIEMGNSDQNKEGYFIKYSFWLQSLGKDASVKLLEGNNLPDTGKYVESNKEDYTGTYVLSKDDISEISGAAAVRMCFVSTKDSTKTTAVFEPNADIKRPDTLKEGTDYAKDNNTTGEATVTVKHDKKGKVYNSTNGVIINLKANTPARISLYVWIEGKDDECVNQISAKNLIGQLVFTKEETAQP